MKALSTAANAHASSRAFPPAAWAHAEGEAERAGEATAHAVLPERWSFASVPVSPLSAGEDALAGLAADAVGGRGRPLDDAMRRTMEARFGIELAGVRLHDDAPAAAAMQAMGAEALALGNDVALGEPHDPTSARGRALLGHELAHVVQQRLGSIAVVQRSDGAPTAPATTLAGLPEADRKRIQVVTTQVAVPDLAEKFAITGTKVTSAFPGGVTAELDASVDPSLHHGLRNVAGSLSAGTELTPAPLSPNSTVTLELDAGGTFGTGIYRFTYHAPPPAGAKKTPQPQRILVEALGKPKVAPGTKPPAPAAEGAPPAPDPVAEKIARHSIAHSYTGPELDALRAALHLVPDSHLAVLSGVKFRRGTVHPRDPKAAGDYDSKAHVITMYNLAFAASEVRSLGAGGIAYSPASRAIVHEIGHALDLAALRKAGIEKKKADAVVADLSKRFPDPDDPTAHRWENPEQEKEIKAVLGAQAKAEKDLLAAKSRSGTTTVKKGGDFEDVIGTAAKGTAFREAATKDSPKAVTAYGNTDWQEAYAEAYSLYFTSPETLRSLRPNVYAHLDATLPK